MLLSLCAHVTGHTHLCPHHHRQRRSGRSRHSSCSHAHRVLYYNIYQREICRKCRPRPSECAVVYQVGAFLLSLAWLKNRLQCRLWLRKKLQYYSKMIIFRVVLSTEKLSSDSCIGRGYFYRLPARRTRKAFLRFFVGFGFWSEKKPCGKPSQAGEEPLPRTARDCSDRFPSGMYQ